MVIRTIIVDDEQPAREELRFLISKYSDFEIIDMCDNAYEALSKILSEEPDVVFFDIEMPEFSGIQLADALKESRASPIIIFVTAYSEYAVKAFEVDAADYLVKPIDESRFNKMIARVRGKVKNRVKEKLDLILGEGRDGIVLLKFKEIVYFSVKNRKVYVETLTKRFLCKNKTLKALEEKLHNKGFFRVHKDYLINLRHVRKLTPWFKGRYIIQMDNGKKLPLSPHHQKAFRDMINL
ncbi:MAG: response regulator transcription factor [Thermotogae bacterium]|nr:response regulator transcription factor [Thermotogota bacterium]